MDVLGEAILRYSIDGRYLGEAPKPETGALGYDHPTELYPLKGGDLLLGDGATRLLRLDEDLLPTQLFDLRGRTVEWPDGQGMIGGISGLTTVDGQLVLLAPLRSAEGVLYAVVQIDLEGGAPASGVPLPGFRREEERFASMAGPLLATAAGRAVLLTLLEGRLALYELTPEPRRLTAFPEGFSVPPEAPPAGGPQAAAAVFAFLEQSKLPLRLYGRGNFLYLLTREPGSRGTAWALHQIDPEVDRILRSMRLPTRANHLYLVPGPQRWALVEKGPVTGRGRQAIPSVVLVPTSWIEDPVSKTLLGNEPPACRSVGPYGSSAAP